MNDIPLELPLKASEAAAVADLIYQQAEGRQLTSDLRNRLGGRAAVLGLTSLVPYFGSLQRDPVHTSSYYLAADGISPAGRRPLLFHIAPASAPAPALFPGSILIGRMRPGGGREIVVNTAPFSTCDHEAIRVFAEKVDPSVLPRPQGLQAALTVATRFPAFCLPAAFEAFRLLLKATGVNMASIAAGEALSPDGHFYEAMLWAAIRAGWREGYTAEAPVLTSGAGAAHPAIRRAAIFTRFPVDTSDLLEVRAGEEHPQPWPDEEIERLFQELLTPEEAAWTLEEMSRPFPAGDRAYIFSVREIKRLAVKHAASLKRQEALYDAVRLARAPAGPARGFDFAPASGSFDAPVQTGDAIFCLHWLKARGRPAQSAILALPEAAGAEDLQNQVAALAAALRPFNVTPSIRYGGGETEETLAAIGRGAGGRVNYYAARDPGDELLAVLRAQPPSSAWRGLSPADEDELDGLPQPLVDDARARAARYLQWVASSLRG